MKTILTSILLMFFGLAFSQQAISEYHLDLFGESYPISVSQENNGDYRFYVEVPPADRTRNVTLSIDADKFEDFKNYVRSARDLYVKWKATAIENQVSDLDKEMDLDRMKITTGFIYGRDWNFDFSVRLKSRFKITEDKHLLVISNTSKLTASDNQYIDVEGFLLAFSNVEEIDSFLEKLSVEKAEEFFADKNSKEDLFKQ